MMKWMLAAGAAALAITAPLAAERGGGNDKRGQAQAQKSDRGGGGQRAQRSGGGDRQIRAQRGGSERQVRAQRGGGERQVRAQRGGGDNRMRQRSVQVDRRGNDNVRGAERRQSFASMQGDRDDRGRRNIERQQPRKIERAEVRGRDRDRPSAIERGRAENVARRDAAPFLNERGRDRDERRAFRSARSVERARGQADFRLADVSRDRVFRVRDVDRRGEVRFRDVDRDNLFFNRLGYGAGGCPPGLARKNNGCLPPGQAAKFIGQPLLAASSFGTLGAVPLSLRGLYGDDDDYYYRYGGGYMYRVDRDNDLIDGLLPLFGAALIGQPLSPYYLNNYNRPSYYNSFYPNSPYDCYQYGYGYVYETDCASGLVEDVIPTYDYGYGVGQLMPASYGYYNVPYAYRSYFADDDDYYYRYAPGSIYRVDRSTSLVSAVVALLTNGLSVGQPLPVGYSAYNVPMAYRSSYYDTADNWYRYDNGYIYSVDPRTRMVNNVAYVIV